MNEYTVTWAIDITAESPLGAAIDALNIQRDAASIATVFAVTDSRGNTHVLDAATGEVLQ